MDDTNITDILDHHMDTEEALDAFMLSADEVQEQDENSVHQSPSLTTTMLLVMLTLFIIQENFWRTSIGKRQQKQWGLIITCSTWVILIL